MRHARIRGAAAAGAIAALSGCGGTTAASNDPSRAETIPLEANQLVLSPAESKRILHWFGELRACLRSQGVAVGTLQATRKQVTLAVDPGIPRRTLGRRALTCGERLGGPPRRSSLQTFRGRLIMYLPRACILDSKVASHVGHGKPAG